MIMYAIVLKPLFISLAETLEGLIHRQLSETCSDGVVDVKNVRSWMRQFKEGRTSCDVMRSISKVS